MHLHAEGKINSPCGTKVQLESILHNHFVRGCEVKRVRIDEKAELDQAVLEADPLGKGIAPPSLPGTSSFHILFLIAGGSSKQGTDTLSRRYVKAKLKVRSMLSFWSAQRRFPNALLTSESDPFVRRRYTEERSRSIPHW